MVNAVEYEEPYYDYEHEAIDENEWYYIVRSETNERYINRSGNINVCTASHVNKLLNMLNIHDYTWEAMTILEYKRKFRPVE